MDDRTTIDDDATPKTDPRVREMLLDDPLSLTGVEVPGDPDLMLRLLVEEYARMGCDVGGILALAEDPFYQAFHGLLLSYGKEELRRRIAEVLARVGVVKVAVVETSPPPEHLVQVERLAPPELQPVEDSPCRA